MEEIPRPAAALDATLVLRIRALWNRSFLIAPPLVKHGVVRFRTIEQANEARHNATVERMRASRLKPADESK